MVLDLDTPSQDQQADQNSRGTNNQRGKERKKERSVIDDLRTIKKAYDKITQPVPGSKIALYIAIGLAVVFVAYFFGGGAGIPIGGSDESSQKDSPQEASSPQVPPILGFTITLTGPTKVENGTDLRYLVKTHYDPSIATVPLSSIEVYDDIPKELSFVSTDGTLKNPTDTSPTWKLQKSDENFEIILHPNAHDVIITNTVSARIVTGPGSGVSATTDSCNGHYDIAATPVGKNFGDPTCSLTTADDRTKLFELLKQLDPKNAYKWYMQIVPCESGYNPNAYLGASQSGQGAYGLFQMNPSGRGNNEYDAGDVDWKTQASNAVTYNSYINGSFAYWACAT